MHLKDIPRMHVQKNMHSEVQRLRKNAPRYLASIIEKTRSFPNLRSIDALPAGSVKLLHGGVASALYSIDTGDSFEVIKLRTDGIEAECEALQAWASQGIVVPSVRKKGTVPGSTKAPRAKYLILDFITEKSGKKAPTAHDYLKKHPGRARRLGQLLGKTLARMHRAKSSRTFGEFADMAGSNRAPLRSWNKYLIGYVRMHQSYLFELGISRRSIQTLMHTIERMHFSNKGTYVHGDYSLRNVMLTSSIPLKAVVFDPNPLIGDPSWDVAIIFNNRDIREKRYDWEPSNQTYRTEYRVYQRYFEGFWKSYCIASTSKMDLQKIRVSQFVKTLLHMQAAEQQRTLRKEQRRLEMRVHRELLFAHIGSLDTQEK